MVVVFIAIYPVELQPLRDSESEAFFYRTKGEHYLDFSSSRVFIKTGVFLAKRWTFLTQKKSENKRKITQHSENRPENS
jgi:hypothetical protein